MPDFECSFHKPNFQASDIPCAVEDVLNKMIKHLEEEGEALTVEQCKEICEKSTEKIQNLFAAVGKERTTEERAKKKARSEAQVQEQDSMKLLQELLEKQSAQFEEQM